MPTCPRCDALLDNEDSLANGCPYCRDGKRDSHLADDAWKTVAGIANLAEGGYLVSRLAAEGIEVRLTTAESFSALGGEWSYQYWLQVPSDQAPAALEQLRTEALEAEEEENALAREPDDGHSVPIVFWRPVALMALAGLGTLWISDQNRLHHPSPPNDMAELGKRVEGLGEPFVIESPRGVEHRLYYRSADETWHLDSDTNGDGRFEQRQQFLLKSEN